MKPSGRVLGAATLALFVGSCASTTIDPDQPFDPRDDILVKFVEGCPSEVVPSAPDCSAPYGGSGTVCRTASANDNSAISQVRWIKMNESDPDFTIRFHDGNGPCTNAVGASKTCVIKKRRQFNFGGKPGLDFKYDVNAANCEPLDPYIIVMR